ncbi:MAG: hypothetical protein E7444_07070 [Ruminococcaceae bacterium]|nr:hypothetical protein [Oscillospiraceae bacterium]
MPLNGYTSLCQKHASIISSKDKGGSQTHIGHNRKSAFVTHYKIDGVVITQGNKCDYLLINEDTHTAYLIELKGSDLCWAAMQLDATEKVLAKQLSGYSLQYRIVANKCKTQEIESTEFKKYRVRWKTRLSYKTMQLKEDI